MQKKPSLHSLSLHVLCALLFLTLPVLSQQTDSPPETNSPEKVTVLSSKCDVYLTGVKLKDVQLTFHSDSSLIAVKGKKKREVLYSDINKIVFRQHRPFGSGFVKGAAAGFVFGFLKKGGISSDISAWGVGALVGLAMAVPGGLIGGIIGVITSSDDEYVFEKSTGRSKAEHIDHVIHKHGALKY